MPSSQVPVREAYPASASEIVERAWVYMNLSTQVLSVLDVSKVPEDHPVMNVNHPDSRMLAFTQQAFLENVALVVNVGEREYGIALHKWRLEQGDETKSPATRHAVISGKPILMQDIPTDIIWREVGYNPTRHDTFVDKQTGMPVLSAAYIKVSSCPVARRQLIYVPV